MPANEPQNIEKLNRRLEALEQKVHRQRVILVVLSLAWLLLAWSLFNDNVRAVLGGILAVLAILVGILTLIAGIRLLLEWLSPGGGQEGSSIGEEVV